MNSKSIIFNLFLITFISLIGCSKGTYRFNGSDNIITLTRDLPSFTKIVANDSFEVNVSQNTNQIVDIMVNDNLQDQIITMVDGSTLFISLADGSYTNETFIVNIELPILERLELNDDCHGEVNFTADQLEFEVDDSSELSLTGSAEILNAIINDDGKINAFSFTAAVVNASVKDDSELEITCTKELNGTVKDDSELSYRGTPIINVNTSDEGRIINAN